VPRALGFLEKVQDGTAVLVRRCVLRREMLFLILSRVNHLLLHIQRALADTHEAWQPSHGR
jgi:hypothetical protein